MKTLILFLLLSFCYFPSFAQQHDSIYYVQPLPLQANHIVYEDTIVLDSSYTKERLFGNAHKWYINNYQTADNVLIVDNTETGQITGTGIVHFKQNDKQKDEQDVIFTIDLYISRGKYVYKVYDIKGKEKKKKFSYSDMYKEEQYPLPKNQWTKEYREYMLSHMDNSIRQMLHQLKKYMQQ